MEEYGHYNCKIVTRFSSKKTKKKDQILHKYMENLVTNKTGKHETRSPEFQEPYLQGSGFPTTRNPDTQSHEFQEPYLQGLGSRPPGTRTLEFRNAVRLRQTDRVSQNTEPPEKDKVPFSTCVEKSLSPDSGEPKKPGNPSSPRRKIPGTEFDRVERNTETEPGVLRLPRQKN